MHFRGKDIEGFLTEYEHFALHANLTDEVKCEEIQIYLSKKEKRVLDVLDTYTMSNWEDLKTELRLAHFDMYRRQFRVITKGLEARNALSDYDWDDYFWSGIHPTSLRGVLEMELRTRDYWTDLTLPPPMGRVIEVAVKFLNRAMYQPRDVDSQSKWMRSRRKKRDSSASASDSLDEAVTDSLASSVVEELSSEEDDDEIEERKKSGKKKSHVEKRVEEKKDKGIKELKEEEKPVVDQNVQSNIEDLADCFKRLELKLGERTGQQSQPPKTQATMYCIMCGLLGHGIRDCSKSKFFIGQDICRMDVNNRVVMSNGTALPCTKGEGGAV